MIIASHGKAQVKLVPCASAAGLKQLGALAATSPELLGSQVDAAFRDQSLGAGTALLSVLDAHVIETAQLPLLHDDPYRCAEDCVYDRLLIAQARVEGLMAASIG